MATPGARMNRRACQWCGVLYTYQRERLYGYCSTRCRTAAHRWIHANGGQAFA